MRGGDVKIPTPKQMALLAEIPVGSAVISPRRNQWRRLLNHGWVEAVWPKEWQNTGLAYGGAGDSYLPSLRITPDGQPDPAEPQSQADARWFGLANPRPKLQPSPTNKGSVAAPETEHV
jgi:hypothetical protein